MKSTKPCRYGAPSFERARLTFRWTFARCGGSQREEDIGAFQDIRCPSSTAAKSVVCDQLTLDRVTDFFPWASSARVFREPRVQIRSPLTAERYVGDPNAAQRPDLAPDAHYVRRRGSAGPSVYTKRRPLAFENTNVQLSPQHLASRRSTYTARRAHRRHPRRPVFVTSPYVRCPAFIRPHRLPCLGNVKATFPGRRVRLQDRACCRHHPSSTAEPRCRQEVWPGRGHFSIFSPTRSAASHACMVARGLYGDEVRVRRLSSAGSGETPDQAAELPGTEAI